MFDLEVDWWELVLRAAIIYCVLLVMVRIAGRRTVGEFTNFDLLLMLLLGNAVSGALNPGDKSVVGGLLIAGTMVSLSMLVAFLSAHLPGIQKAVEGPPVLIGLDGEIFESELKRLRVPLGDVYQALRKADCDQADMRFAYLEADGEISILKESRQPAGEPPHPKAPDAPQAPQGKPGPAGRSSKRKSASQRQR